MSNPILPSELGSAEAMGAISPESFDLLESVSVYKSFHDKNDDTIRVGLFGDELEDSLRNPQTITVSVAGGDRETTLQPVLVPTKDLEWYNDAHLRQKYGDDTRIYAYAHPPFLDEDSRQTVKDAIKTELDKGSVIITELYTSDKVSPIAEVVQEAQEGRYEINVFGDDIESKDNVFVGTVNINGVTEVRPAPTIYEVYENLISSGTLERNPVKGASLIGVIEGEDAERIWTFYKASFDDLGKDEPFNSGFDRDSFLDILRDPDTAKVINRVDGEITTLVFFLQKFDKAPWFNDEAYKARFPEYFSTNNIFMFPGIVTDPEKRGNDYSMDVINLANNLLAKRGSNFLVTFECTGISSTYVPKIVEAALNEAGVSKISGLENPVSTINYYGISAVKSS